MLYLDKSKEKLIQNATAKSINFDYVQRFSCNYWVDVFLPIEDSY